ncbi:hypothetical protein GALMADRAFT_878042 [Galerina marginata CBS 339.88]|uniref:Uncharacterized protein n=1 Tax=Galerina marginata (strain CBS 339.88) TaxID=685588 RepID=A0A067SI33_GALM3|nr:hypothetical protein GALMADRAFT_878042 [Galerina marginata CBS 339.88]
MPVLAHTSVRPVSQSSHRCGLPAHTSMRLVSQPSPTRTFCLMPYPAHRRWRILVATPSLTAVRIGFVDRRIARGLPPPPPMSRREVGSKLSLPIVAVWTWALASIVGAWSSGLYYLLKHEELASPLWINHRRQVSTCHFRLQRIHSHFDTLPRVRKTNLCPVLSLWSMLRLVVQTKGGQNYDCRHRHRHWSLIEGTFV